VGDDGGGDVVIDKASRGIFAPDPDNTIRN